MAQVVELPVFEPVHLDLLVADRDVVAELTAIPEGALRDDYALQALRIGVLALRQARGEIDREALRREADKLVGDVREALTKHQTDVSTRIETSLKEYLDPEKGHFQAGAKALLGPDGELATLLHGEVDGDDSAMAKTLAAHIGDRSPIMRLLDPEQASGLVQTLTKAIEEELQAQREKIVAEFTLDRKDSALSRLVKEIAESNGELTGQLDGKVKSLMDELTLDDEKSAMARLKRELLDVADRQQKQLTSFQEEVRVSLERLETRKATAAKSNIHGWDFEDQMIEVVSTYAQSWGDLVIDTSDLAGLKSRCKRGDCVVELGSDKRAAGAKIVLEAKDEAGFTLQKAREEIEEARKNRGAEIGIFVFSAATCPSEIEGFCRLGNDVFIGWDPDEPDVSLRAALSIATALCTRASLARDVDSADFDEIEAAILEIERQSKKVGEMSPLATTIRNNADEILKRIRISCETLERQIEKLRAKTQDVQDVLDSLVSDS